MSTEDDLRRAGQAAAALMGLAATRAKQVAEQLLGSRENSGQDVRHRAESFFEESRSAAADVVNTLRREASVVLHDLEQLEHNLRRRQDARAGDATASDDDDEELTPPTPIRPVAGSTRATKAGVRPVRAPATPGKTTGARKATSPDSTHTESTGPESTGTGSTGPGSTGPGSTGPESAGTAKTPGARKTTSTRKATGSSRPPTGGQV
jgi:hypothetical protein